MNWSASRMIRLTRERLMEGLGMAKSVNSFGFGAGLFCRGKPVYPVQPLFMRPSAGAQCTCADRAKLNRPSGAFPRQFLLVRGQKTARLVGPQAGIMAVLGDQFGVGALFDNLARVEHNQAVHRRDG